MASTDQPSRENTEFYQDQARNLLDEVLDRAAELISPMLHEKLDQVHTVPGLSRDHTRLMGEESPLVGVEPETVGNIQWCSIGEFTVQKGEEKIREFIDTTWQRDPQWLYCVDYLGNEEKEFDKRHFYRVRWSIPTRCKPIPTATACVYFTFSLHKHKPKDHSTTVVYVFESNRLVHEPGKSLFKEEWLKTIVDNKARLMQRIRF